MKNTLFTFLMLSCFITNAQQQFIAYFDSNKFTLNKSETEKLNQWIKDHNDVKIVGANGFCDEDGSTIANDTLAQRRINTIFNIIKDKLNVRNDYKTRSFGELHQLSKNKAENRKVVLFYLEQKDLSRENEILGIKNEIVSNIIKEKIKFPEKISFQNFDGTISEMPLDQEFMATINESKSGSIFNIKNLNFVINTFIVVPESRARMYELLTVMQLNPTLTIEIQGHLCCNVDDKKDLSGQRAKAIYNFLVANDISKSRLSFKGFGGTRTLFPIPEKSEMERAANRRVEILIVSNE